MYNTKKTYNDKQVMERGSELAMAASEKLLAAIGGGVQTANLNADIIHALSEAVTAGANMILSTEAMPEEERPE